MDKRNTYTKSAGFVPGLRKVLMPGELVDNRYELLELLGDGGMGSVYKAKHLVLDITVALKVLHYRGVNDTVSRDRFLSEARSMKAVNHEYIPEVYDAGISMEGYYYLVTEYLEGETFKSRLQHQTDRNEIFLKQVVDYMTDICEGVRSAHENGIIHRDLKPSNIFLARDKHGNICPKILDFGLAVRNAADDGSDDTVGTDGYMSPEQKAGVDVGTGTDIYSLGVILYEAITGILPMRDDKDRMFSRSEKDLYRIVPPDRINPCVPRKLSRICMIALERDANDRFRSVSELFNSLCSVWPTGTLLKKRKQFRSKLLRRSAVGLAFIGLVGSAWWLGVNFGSQKGKTTDAAVIAVELKQPRTSVQQGPTEIEPSAKETSPVIRPTPAPSSAATLISNSTNETLTVVSPSPKKSQTSKTATISTGKVAANETDKEQIVGLIDEGYRELRSMRLDKAEELFTGALKIIPNDPEALFGLGRVMFEKENYRLAAVRMESALRQKNNAEWRISLGKTFLMLGQNELALKECTKAVVDFPDNDALAGKAGTCIKQAAPVAKTEN